MSPPFAAKGRISLKIQPEGQPVIALSADGADPRLSAMLREPHLLRDVDHALVARPSLQIDIIDALLPQIPDKGDQCLISIAFAAR